MARNPPVIHGRDHLPGGADPIPRTSVVTGELTDVALETLTVLDLPMAGDLPGLDGWQADTSEAIPGHPITLIHQGTGPDSLQWLVSLKEGDWKISFTHKVASAGTATLYVSGAYSLADLVSTPDPGDWVQIASVDYLTDFGVGRSNYVYTREWSLDGGEQSVWQIPPAADVPRYTLATSMSGGANLLNGSPGYYYIRLDGEGDLMIARMLLTCTGTDVGGYFVLA